MLVEQLRNATDQGVAAKVSAITAAMQKSATEGDKMLAIAVTDDMDVESILAYYRKEGISATLRTPVGQPRLMVFNWRKSPLTIQQRIMMQVKKGYHILREKAKKCYTVLLKQKDALLNRSSAAPEATPRWSQETEKKS